MRSRDIPGSTPLPAPLMAAIPSLPHWVDEMDADLTQDGIIKEEKAFV